MKKIIINGRFLLHRVTGVERYAREMVNALDELTAPGQLEIAVPPEVNELPEWKNITVRRVGGLHNRMWEHFSFPAYVRRQGGIALNLCNVAPLPAPGIVTIHDMKPIVHPEYYSEKFVLWYRLLFRNAFQRARMVLTVSKFSAREIRRYYRIDPHRISITPEGWQQFGRLEYDEYALERYGLEKGGYYFSMGSRDPAKNLSWVIESARANPEMIYAISGNVNREIFADSGVDLEKTASGCGRRNDGATGCEAGNKGIGSGCEPGNNGIGSEGETGNIGAGSGCEAGNKGIGPGHESGNSGIGSGRDSKQIPENVRFLGYVRDEEAKTLMRDCKAFLFPSFYEGFGLPPLEALSAGCPCVVVSDIPVMHELFEDEAVYVDPYKVEEFTCRKPDAEKILKKYSWKKSARKLLRILESV